MPDLSQRIFYRVPDMERVRVQRDVVYRRVDDADLLMDVYALPDVRAGKQMPAVVFVHGGPIASEMRPKDWGVYQSYGELVAASGLIGVTFNHRFFSRESLAEAERDICAAVDYVRAHADELRVDPDRLCVWVFSGGGPFLSWVLCERPPFVRCIAAYYALLDLRHMLPSDADDALKQRAAKFSPAAHVANAGDLPIFVARAGQDRPSLNQGTDSFVREALAANAPLELMNHPHGQHAFDVLNDDARTREIIARTLAFIKTHLYAQNP
ncbi:MAG: prolyl oligopeptidase family serine peptidase [Chloroflexota bacterium]